MTADPELGGDILEQGRELIRQNRDIAWQEGYEACRRGEQKHSPYRARSKNDNA